MIRFVLFDLGGVLFDFDHRIASRAIAHRCGLGEAEIHERVFASGLEASYDAGEISTLEFLEELRSRTDYLGTLEQLRAAWAEIFRTKSEVWETVDRLVAAEVPLGVVSNTNEIHFEQLEAMADFGRRFRWLFLSYRLRVRKPEAGFYSAVTRHLPFDRAEGLFVDDRRENVDGAIAAGFRGHLFVDAEGLEAELGRHSLPGSVESPGGLC